jgi:hypothetical protein
MIGHDFANNYGKTSLLEYNIYSLKQLKEFFLYYYNP